MYLLAIYMYNHTCILFYVNFLMAALCVSIYVWSVAKTSLILL